MAERPPYRARRARGGPAGTACGFWRSLTDWSRVALVVLLAVLLACLASAAAAPAYRGTFVVQPALTLSDTAFDTVVNVWQSQRLAFLDSGLEETLRQASVTGERLAHEMDQLNREAVGRQSMMLSSLEVIADGSELQRDGAEGLRSRANEVADRYRPTYESYLSRVAAITETVKRSEVPGRLEPSLRDSIEACDLAASSLLTSLGALELLRGGDAAAIAAAEVEASEAAVLIEGALERLSSAMKSLGT
ncbi:MAG: hypothetical protein KKF41_00910 [Actinobacteria bacterium]|nr:hypothetical protein [Actinomycetota bacterium]MBU1942804.1 hypothetical protein [Actinomycetota bacterium]MBU2686126.1 hypothetical protein [Actinomycetota bacterium]